MELTSAFSVSATAGAETVSQGETASSGDAGGLTASFAESSATSSQASNDNATSADSSDVATVDPEAQALNDSQDLRLAAEARISDVNMRARQRVEEDLARRYGDNIRQLQGEISDLQNVLDSSGPVRLAWLELTRQISRDPHRDLNLLRSTKEMYESYQTQERQMFDERIREEAEAHKSQALPNAPTQKMETQDDRTITREQALERLEFLEAHRSAPTAEMHLRPGDKTEQFVNGDVAAHREAEISALKASIKAHDGPDQVPKCHPVFDDGLEPSIYGAGYA